MNTCLKKNELLPVETKMKVLTAALMACLLTLASTTKAETPSNFTLEAVVDDSNVAVDTKFELKEHRGKTVVLHFLLETECPFCLKYTNEYALLAEATPEVVHLFIKPDSAEAIRSWAQRLDKAGLSKFPTIFRDPGASLAKRFGIPDGYEFHGQSVHYPAMVVLNEDGEEVFRYVGKSNSDRMPKADFVTKLEQMTGK
jgi:thioredoxin-dependent peroxiredoxin